MQKKKRKRRRRSNTGDFDGRMGSTPADWTAKTTTYRTRYLGLWLACIYILLSQVLHARFPCNKKQREKIKTVCLYPFVLCALFTCFLRLFGRQENGKIYIYMEEGVRNHNRFFFRFWVGGVKTYLCVCDVIYRGQPISVAEEMGFFFFSSLLIFFGGPVETHKADIVYIYTAVHNITIVEKRNGLKAKETALNVKVFVLFFFVVVAFLYVLFVIFFFASLYFFNGRTRLEMDSINAKPPRLIGFAS